MTTTTQAWACPGCGLLYSGEPAERIDGEPWCETCIAELAAEEEQLDRLTAHIQVESGVLYWLDASSVGRDGALIIRKTLHSRTCKTTDPVVARRVRDVHDRAAIAAAHRELAAVTDHLNKRANEEAAR